MISKFWSKEHVEKHDEIVIKPIDYLIVLISLLLHRYNDLTKVPKNTHLG